MFATTLAAPARGLLLVAVLAPLGHLLAVASGQPAADLTDWIAAAFIAGWVLRGMPDARGPRIAAPLAAWLFCAVAVGSAAAVGLDPSGIAAAIRVVLAFALAAATVKIFRQHPGLSIGLPVAMAVGASIAVLAPPFDAHASLGYFALTACLSAGMAVREQGHARIAWAAVTLWLVFGLGMVISRPPSLVLGVSRTQPLIASTLRMLSERPLFGVGIGQDDVLAPLFLSPWLSWHGGALGSHNLLGIAAELGLVGLVLWCVWIGAGLLRAARALARDPRDARLWGATTGVAAYVAALAVSRPLAFSETAFSFLLQFGLMTGLGGSTLLDTTTACTRRPRWTRVAAASAMAAIAAGAFASGRQGPIEPPASQEADGYASVVVPADVMRVQLPVRARAAPAGSSVQVEIKVDGGQLQAATVGRDWRNVDVPLQESSATGRFHRIDVRMPEAGSVEIGDVHIGLER